MNAQTLQETVVCPLLFELTTAVKALADTAKQLVSVYAKQQGQIAQLVKRVEELEKQNEKG